MENDPPTGAQGKTTVNATPPWWKLAWKLEFLPFTILVILSAISLISRVILLLR